MKYKALLLDGSHTGKMIDIEDNCNEQELNKKKENMKFSYGHEIYAGYCRRCGGPVRLKEASYIDNIDGLGKLHVDVFHKICL